MPLWDNDFLPRTGELAAQMVEASPYCGVCRMPVDAEPGEFEYLACAEVRSLDNLPRSMVGREIPAMTYAVFLANDVPDLGRVFESPYCEWIPQSRGWEEAEGEWILVYPQTYPQDNIIYVYCPVRRK